MYLLSCANLGAFYRSGDGGLWAIRHVNLSFPSSGLFAIKGKSGSGKSTLLNLLSLLEKPSEGKIFFKGKRVDNLSAKKKDAVRRGEFSTVFQHYNLIDGLTVYQNVALPLSISGARKSQIKSKTEESLKKVNLWEIHNQKAATLSGGEKQRVAIARCLVEDPSIIFADEPTGALDINNGEIIMSLLKEISKTKLIILVSHNEDIIERYADEVITLIDGKQVSPMSVTSSNEKAMEIKQSSGGNIAFLPPFIKKNIWDNRYKNALTFASALVGFSSLLICLGYYLGSPQSLLEERSRTLETSMCSISEKTYVAIEDSPLSLVSQNRPSLDTAIDTFSSLGNDYLIGNDYSYFFPSYMAFDLDGEEMNPASFVPVYDLTLSGDSRDLVYKGNAPTFNSLAECLVNKEFEEEFAIDEIIGSYVSISYESSITSSNVTDKVNLDLKMQIVGVVDEFSFLNTPKVYYSYKSLDYVFSHTSLSNLSTAKGEEVTITSFVDDIDGSSVYGNYDYLVFLTNINLVDDFFSLIGSYQDSNLISIDSNAYTIYISFQELSNAFSTCLLMFVGIAFFGVFAILAMASYSSILERKKESAILRSLGAGEKHLMALFLLEACLVCLLSALLALVISPLLSFLLNNFLYANFGLSELIRIPYTNLFGIPFLMPILLVIFALLVALISTFIPLRTLSSLQLVEELRDE